MYGADLHRRMTVRLYGAGMISKLKLWGGPLQEKVITSRQLQCYCCEDAETVFLFSRGDVSLKLKSKAKRLCSSSVPVRIIRVYFCPVLHLAGQSL